MFRRQLFRLYPTTSQEEYFLQCVGAARYAYNWGLALNQRYYRRYGRNCHWMRLATKWRQIKRTVNRKAWVQDISKIVTSIPLKDLGDAYKRWFSYLNSKKSGKVARPVRQPAFKTKAKSRRRFTIADEGRLVRIDRGRIKLPSVGWVATRSERRWPSAPHKSAAVIERGGYWFLSVLFELPDPKPEPHTGPSCGIDLGITTFATIASEGRAVDEVKPPKPYAKAKRRLRRLQSRLDRMMSGSKNREKSRVKLGRLHLRVANIRHDFLHKMSRKVVNTYGMVVLEDLNVAALSKSHFRKSVRDLGIAEFRRQVEYKSSETGTRIVIAPRFFPSTKTCSQCGIVNRDVVLGVVAWDCPSCHAHHHRDHNAAINLEKLGRGTPKVTPAETGGSGERKRPGAGRGSRKATL